MRNLMRAPLSRRQVEMMADHFSVGETYFFRDPAVFAALEHTVLPDLIAARRDAGRRLRIWSAGCCTGEEAYSIAILVSRMIPDLDDWNITILGTDINAGFLKKARQGVYRDRSFRGVPSVLKRQYFEAVAADSYAIRPKIKRLVSFDHLNLASGVYPAIESNTNAIDIILCRNVLMYFERDQIIGAVSKLHRALVEGGWLIVSATEAGQHLFSDFSTVQCPDAILYRKEEARKTKRTASLLPFVPLANQPAWATQPESDGFEAWLAGQGQSAAPPSDPVASYQLALTHYTQGAYEHAVTVLKSGACHGPLELGLLARACANCGQLAEAANWCEAAIAADKCSSGLRYLHAVILEEQGELEQALAALKRALYLDQNFVLAHFTLGNLYRRQGKHGEAARHFGHAVTLLQDCPADAVLPEWEGMAAGRLIEIIRTREVIA